MGQIYQVELGLIRVGSKKIKLRKDGSGLGQIYQVELGLIRVGSKKIKLRKDGSGLGRIYQVEKNWNVVEVYISCKGRIGHG